MSMPTLENTASLAPNDCMPPRDDECTTVGSRSTRDEENYYRSVAGDPP